MPSQCQIQAINQAKMEWLFGKQKTPQEMLKQHQRSLQHALRDLDRERVKLEQQEKKLINDIKTTAKKGQMGAVKVMAKDLVRTRKSVEKFYSMRTQLQAVSLRIQTLRSNAAMTSALKGVTKALKGMNQQLNLPALLKIMQDFERESEIMDMKDEVMSDAIDEAMDEEEGEDEEEKIVQQVLDEIGIDLGGSLVEVPNKEVEEKPVGEDAALQARLENLRRD